MEDCRKPFEQKGLGYGIKTYSVSSGKSIVPVDVNITAGKTKTLVSFNILDTAKNYGETLNHGSIEKQRLC